MDHSYGNLEADCNEILVIDDSYDIDLPHHAIAKSDGPAGNIHLTTATAGPSTVGKYSIAISYADSNASLQMNRAYPTSSSLSQVSGFCPTPSTSENEFINDNSQPDDSVSSSYGRHPQRSVTQLPTEKSGPTPLESWHDVPERHESIAYRLAKPVAHLSMKEKKPTEKSQKARKHK